MKVNVRKGKTTGWGLTETFQVYRYADTGSISVTVVVGQDGRMAEPYVFRGGEFIPARVIHEEMGVEKYLTAKKPFYCKLQDGFVVRIKAGLNFNTGEYLPEKSSYDIYNATSSDMGVDKGVLTLTRILEITDYARELMENLTREVASCRGDREKFLLSRFK